MKALLVSPVVTLTAVGSLALALSAAGVHVRPAEPLAAGVISALAAMLGMLPLSLRRRADVADAWIAALAGTVIHLLVIVIGAGALLLSGVVAMRGAFPYWMIGGYWISLILLVRQARQLAMKVQTQC
jgi:hypothetical protein